MCALTPPSGLEGFVERTLGRATSLQVELTEDRHPQDLHFNASTPALPPSLPLYVAHTDWTPGITGRITLRCCCSLNVYMVFPISDLPLSLIHI